MAHSLCIKETLLTVLRVQAEIRCIQYEVFGVASTLGSGVTARWCPMMSRCHPRCCLVANDRRNDPKGAVSGTAPDSSVFKRGKMDTQILAVAPSSSNLLVEGPCFFVFVRRGAAQHKWSEFFSQVLVEGNQSIPMVKVWTTRGTHLVKFDVSPTKRWKTHSETQRVVVGGKTLVVQESRDYGIQWSTTPRVGEERERERECICFYELCKPS